MADNRQTLLAAVLAAVAGDLVAEGQDLKAAKGAEEAAVDLEEVVEEPNQALLDLDLP